MKKLLITAVLSGLMSSAAIAADDLTPSVEGAKTYIISPIDGATVSSPLTVKFGLIGMGVAPAGIDKPKTGHHHLLIDGKMLPKMNMALGKNVKHFGGGQTETTLTLEPGTHTLQLILGDKGHVPHNPPVVSEKITITVK
jgi:opacity protein-like surface antigen